jgi:serine/threonine-protein kinase ATR
VPHLDEASRLEIKDFIQHQAQEINYGKLLQAVNKRANAIKVDGEFHKAPTADSSAHTWRREARNIVQVIVQPEDLDWMEDDEGISDLLFIERALNNIQSRFQRYPVELNVPYLRSYSLFIDRCTIPPPQQDLLCFGSLRRSHAL